MQIGKYKLSFINTASFALDGGAMFGIIPKPLWTKGITPDKKNRIPMGVRCLLLESDKKKILVDTGMGNFWEDKFKKIYNIDYSNFSLELSLNIKKLKNEDITDVILTHLHFDHTGGSVISENGKNVPAFPNAKYHVQKKQFDWALKPSQKDKGSFIPSTFMPLANEGVLNFVNGDEFFDDEIQFITINGHTIAQQMIKIADSSNTFLLCADLIPTLHHIPIPYVMGYDIQPLETIKEKQKFLNLAVEENWKLIFEHDVTNAYATITKNERGYRHDKIFKELL